MRPEPKVTCKHCGSDRIDVEFRASGRGNAVFGVEPGRGVYVDCVEDRDYDMHDVDYDTFICRGCGKRTWKADELVKASPVGPEHLAVGDTVFLPDNLKGIVETVDYEDATFTVEGWHETFSFYEAQVVDLVAMFARAA